MALRPLLLLALASAGASGALIPANDPRVRVVGRTLASGSALLFDWSSVYIEAQATGPLSLVVAEGWAHGNEYNVSLNGTYLFQLNTSQATQQFPFRQSCPGPQSSSSMQMGGMFSAQGPLEVERT